MDWKTQGASEKGNINGLKATCLKKTGRNNLSAFVPCSFGACPATRTPPMLHAHAICHPLLVICSFWPCPATSLPPWQHDSCSSNGSWSCAGMQETAFGHLPRCSGCQGRCQGVVVVERSSCQEGVVGRTEKGAVAVGGLQ